MMFAARFDMFQMPSNGTNFFFAMVKFPLKFQSTFEAKLKAPRVNL